MQPAPYPFQHLGSPVGDMSPVGGLVICEPEEIREATATGIRNNKGSMGDMTYSGSPTFGSSKIGRRITLLAASSQSVVFPSGVLATRTEGEVIIQCKLVSQAGPRAVISSFNGIATTGLSIIKTGTGLTLLTNDGSDESVVTGGGAIANDTWHLIGCSWGPAGKFITVDGNVAAKDVAKVAGSGATNTTAIGRTATTTYTSMDIGWFAVFNKQYGPWIHREWTQLHRAA